MNCARENAPDRQPILDWMQRTRFQSAQEDLLAGSSEMIAALGISLHESQADESTDDEAEEVHLEGEAEKAHRTARPRVLVVDDDPTVLLIGKHMLEKLGCEVQTQDDGPAAVEIARSGSVDLIFVDYHLPTMDGPTATVEIRRMKEGNQHLPIIAISSAISAYDRKICLASGMDDYIPKPIRLADLREMLERWLPTPKEPPI